MRSEKFCDFQSFMTSLEQDHTHLNDFLHRSRNGLIMDRSFRGHFRAAELSVKNGLLCTIRKFPPIRYDVSVYYIYWKPMDRIQ